LWPRRAARFLWFSPPDQKETPVGRNSQNQPPPTTDLATLVRAAQQGCSDAFNALARRYEKMIFASALRKLGHFHDAEDETQNILAEVFTHLHSLEDAGRFEPWLRCLVRNRCVDRLRRRMNVECAVEFQDEAELSRDAVSQCELPDITKAVKKLSAPLRETLELHYFQNYSLKEISARLAVPLNTVKRRLHDARQKLKQTSTKNSEIAPNLPATPFDVISEDVDQTKSTEPA
jgi:RNA polymerase sigma factor (sigma-70 family)